MGTELPLCWYCGHCAGEHEHEPPDPKTFGRCKATDCDCARYMPE